MSSSLPALAAARAAGVAPGLPVFVTDMGLFARNVAGAGAWVVAVAPGADAWDWSPLAGLEVILMFNDPTTPDARRVAVTVRDVGRPRRLTVYDPSAPFGERLSAVMPV